MDRWFIVVMEGLCVLGALEALWWGYEYVRSWEITNEHQDWEQGIERQIWVQEQQALQQALQAPKRKPRKAKTEGDAS